MAASMPRQCRFCTHFCSDPAYLEAVFPGLTSLSSAYASVRAEDGLCRRHDRYLSARSGCENFSPGRGKG